MGICASVQAEAQKKRSPISLKSISHQPLPVFRSVPLPMRIGERTIKSWLKENPFTQLGVLKMYRDFRKLRHFQIFKSDQTYKTVVKKRIQRLKRWKIRASNSSINELIDININLTTECDEIADALKSAIRNLIQTIPDNVEQAFERVSKYEENTIFNSPEMERFSQVLTGMEEISIRQRELRLIAKKLVLEAISQKLNTEENILDFIDRNTLNYSEIDQYSIRDAATWLVNGYGTYMDTLDAALLCVKLPELHRGLLYMGVINITGHEIDKKVFLDHAKEIGKQSVGSIPVASEILSLIGLIKELDKMIKDFLGDEVPDIVENTHFLEQSLLKYAVALNLWKKLAHTMISQLEDWTKTTKQYSD